MFSKDWGVIVNGMEGLSVFLATLSPDKDLNLNLQDKQLQLSQQGEWNKDANKWLCKFHINRTAYKWFTALYAVENSTN